MSVLPASEDSFEENIRFLIALRDAKENGTPEPGLPFEAALHLGALGYVRAKAVLGMPTGGYEITDHGLGYLAELQR